MQNPNEDTEWNSILRSKGILPPKEKEVDEDTVVKVSRISRDETLASFGSWLTKPPTPKWERQKIKQLKI